MPKPRPPQFAVWLFDRALFEALKATAATEGRTVSRLVEALVRDYLHRPRTPLTAAHKVCPICDAVFVSQTRRQVYCGAGNRRCMKYAQRYGVPVGRLKYAARYSSSVLGSVTPLAT